MVLKEEAYMYQEWMERYNKVVFGEENYKDKKEKMTLEERIKNKIAQLEKELSLIDEDDRVNLYNEKRKTILMLYNLLEEE